MTRVLVTGANGHVGNTLTRLLVEKGYAVRATVRDPKDPEKTKPLQGLDVEIVAADVMDAPSMQKAAAGCEGIFQVAAVYKTHAKDPQREIVEPSVVGGLNVLRAAKAAGARRVVFTSSIAAVGSHAPEGRELTEADWNDGAASPYFHAKTEAERRAWAFAKLEKLDLIAINPGAIIGPGFHRHTPSTLAFEMLLRGKLPFTLPLGLTFVDVRDVAEAHRLVFEKAEAKGRYLAADRFLRMNEVMQCVSKIFPEVKVPRRTVPKALLGALPPLDWLSNALLGTPRQVTRAMVAELGGKDQRASSAKLRSELGWTPMSFEHSLRETLEWIRATFMRGACSAP